MNTVSILITKVKDGRHYKVFNNVANALSFLVKGEHINDLVGIVTKCEPIDLNAHTLPTLYTHPNYMSEYAIKQILKPAKSIH